MKNQKITQKDINLNYNNINYDYLAGLVHADGTFTNVLVNNRSKIYLYPRFILTQHNRNRDMINNIKILLNNKWYIKLSEKTKILKYTITNLDDIINILIPIFDKHQVRSNRYYSYLKFKLLASSWGPALLAPLGEYI